MASEQWEEAVSGRGSATTQCGTGGRAHCQMLRAKHTLSVCWATGSVMYEPVVSVESHHLRCRLRFNKVKSAGQQSYLEHHLQMSYTK